VRLFLDTHIALWAVTNHPNLSDLAKSLISDPENDIFVSAATIWEIAIKHASEKANAVPMSGKDALETFHDAGYEMLDITPTHVTALETLPMLHRDPFDRILVAQSISIPLRLVTRDAKVAAYSDTIILA